MIAAQREGNTESETIAGKEERRRWERELGVFILQVLEVSGWSK